MPCRAYLYIHCLLIYSWRLWLDCLALVFALKLYFFILEAIKSSYSLIAKLPHVERGRGGNYVQFLQQPYPMHPQLFYAGCFNDTPLPLKHGFELHCFLFFFTLLDFQISDKLYLSEKIIVLVSDEWRLIRNFLSKYFSFTTIRNTTIKKKIKEE